MSKFEECNTQRGSGSQYLLEVQGLRTIAAFLVAIYHVWLHRVSGGVDVFFVVSAYFLVSALMRREPITANHITQYYASTARRVIPSTVVIVVATVIVALFLMPKSDWRHQIDHAYASLLFVENWQLIAAGADYLQQGLAVSPFQQLWALSLQGQMYVALPIIYGIASLLGRMIKIGCTAVCIVAFAVTFCTSLGYSIYLTAIDQQTAYFNSYTRVWEFSAGALLALTITKIRIPSFIAKIIGWLAFIALLTLGIVVDVSEQFPGYIAAIPVLAAILVIISASNGGNIIVLTNRPVVAFADMSFSFYLWHWPLLIFARYQLQSTDVGVFGISIILGAGILAYATTKWIETPFRRSVFLEERAVASFVACFGIMFLAGLAPLGWNTIYQSKLKNAWERVDALRADPDGFTLFANEIVPDPIIARQDYPPAGYGRSKNGCNQSLKGSEVRTCEFGDRSAVRTVALVGGSHSLQWLPALNIIGQNNGFKVVNITKSACIFIIGEYGDKTCPEWNKDVLTLLADMKPDLVVTIGTKAIRDNSGRFIDESILAGYSQLWKVLGDIDIPVLAIRDNPWFAYDVVNCVDMSRQNPDSCAAKRSNRLAEKSPFEDFSQENVYTLDLIDLFCDEEICRVLDGGVLIYRDHNHLTQSFVLRNREHLSQAIDEVFARSSNSARQQ